MAVPAVVADRRSLAPSGRLVSVPSATSASTTARRRSSRRCRRSPPDRWPPKPVAWLWTEAPELSSASRSTAARVPASSATATCACSPVAPPLVVQSIATDAAARLDAGTGPHVAAPGCRWSAGTAAPAPLPACPTSSPGSRVASTTPPTGAAEDRDAERPAVVRIGGDRAVGVTGRRRRTCVAPAPTVSVRSGETTTLAVPGGGDFRIQISLRVLAPKRRLGIADAGQRGAAVADRDDGSPLPPCTPTLTTEQSCRSGADGVREGQRTGAGPCSTTVLPTMIASRPP